MQCPECSDYLRPQAVSCKCGWVMAKAHPSTGDGGPPNILDVLVGFLAGYRAQRSLPIMMPSVLMEAAQWWLTIQQPADVVFEAPRQLPVKNSDRMFWKCPYHDRALYTLRKFLSLKLQAQQIIVAASEDKIFWRGDDIDFFMRVIHETEEMRSVGVLAYRVECMKKTNGFIGATAIPTT